MKTLKVLLQVVISICFSFSTFCYSSAQTTIEVSGVITADSTWSADTVKITGDVTVNDNVTLTIEPGTYVEFQDYYKLYINGTLIAEGDPVDSITFTVNDTIGWSSFESTDGGWGGIEFKNTLGYMNDNDSSLFKYCRFFYAKSMTYGGVIYIYDFDRLSIKNCLFNNNYAKYNGAVIWLRGAGISITDNLFLENYANSGGAVNIYSGSPVIENNHFKENFALQGGGAIYIQGGGAYILNNEFESDTTNTFGSAIYAGGQDSVIITENHIHNSRSRQGAIYVNSTKVRIEKNDIHDNTSFHQGAGITLASGSMSLVLDNDIYNNTAGKAAGGIYVWAATTRIGNNRIYNNTSDQAGGAIMVSGGSMELTNNEIHHNSSSDNGGAIRIMGGTHTLDKNNIYDNTSGGYGGGISLWQVSPTISNCLIANNWGYEGGGISFEDSHGVFRNNIIVNNEALKGGALSLNGSNPLFINNTVCNNKATDASSGGAVYVKLQSTPNFYNSIFYGNISDADTNQFCFTSLNPSSSFYHCNIEGGKEEFIQPVGSDFFGKYVNGLDTLSLFTAPSSDAGNAGDGPGADWRLVLASPCLNKGTKTISGSVLTDKDFYGNNRICYGYVDIGAHEYHDTVMEVIGQTYTEDLIWAADTIKMNGDVTIETGYKLTIHPGVYVKSQGHYTIKIKGLLHALGTKSDSIIFTVKDTTGFSNTATKNGAWGGILFSYPPATDSSLILYSRIEYFKDRAGAITIPAAVTAFSTPKLRIQSCTFRNNFSTDGAGLRANESPIMVSECSFINNKSLGSGSAIYLAYSNANIVNCFFDSNSGEGNGTIRIEKSDPVISNCIITNNMVSGSGGGLFMENSSNPLITNNLICNNTAEGEGGGIANIGNSAPDIQLNHISNNRGLKGGGVYIYRPGNTGSVVNNIISNNSATGSGGGMYIEDADLDFVNNTITKNRAGTVGGGVYLDGASVSVQNVSFVNTILWGNQDTAGLNQVHIYSGKGCSFTWSDIQGGLDSFTETFAGDWVQVYEHNIDSMPMFRNETQGTGADFNTIPGDWYIESNSPAINTGTPDISALNIPDKDMLGNARIHAAKIDMGAVENQDGAPIITMQPATLSKCEGEQVVFKVQTNDSVFYRWQKDGTDIPGATHPNLLLDSILISDQGNYSCVITNSYGSAFSYPAYLYVKEKPTILQGPVDTWAEPDAPAILETFAQGSDLKYQWLKDGLPITGATIPKLTISQPGFDDEGMYQCRIYNTCSADTTVPVALFMVPQICMVTVDPLTGHNLVIWEKESKAPLDVYNIYRESEAAGIYDLLGTLPFADLSIFVDTTADPTVQAYLYKITGIDTSGYETDIDLCKPHKTIHLLVSTNPELNTTQLEWDKYYGFEYQTYHILRSATGTNFTEVHSIASTLASWTDPDPLPDVGYYRITVEKPDPCYPTGGSKKADAGPYSHSMSNMEDNRLQEVQENQAPTDINLSNNTIAENQSIGTLVGRLETTDADTADHHTYKLVSGSGDTDNNRFTTLGDLLITAEILDYETKDTLSVRVKSTDKGDLSVEEIFIILVTDVNEGAGNLAPTDITLSFNSIEENKPVGTLIGKFQATDPNEDDMHTYGLVAGLGGDDNASFTVLGDMLISSAIFDYETKNEYAVRVRTRDDGDGRLSFEKSFTIYVNDLVETEITDHQVRNEGIEIYPNPFSDRTVIRFENPEGERYSLYVTDLAGKVVYFEDNIFTNQIEFNRDGMADGCYFVELRGPAVYRGKVVLE
ncbi:MAG: hypothetical protein AMS27_14350 [Bacteroides sp. SM23_62_1]|nr:MAG: hypothetical protein AMS27_14350 [Bacteroides sp. SM23_62_1]